MAEKDGREVKALKSKKISETLSWNELWPLKSGLATSNKSGAWLCQFRRSARHFPLRSSKIHHLTDGAVHAPVS